jgi:hypothetical protein
MMVSCSASAKRWTVPRCASMPSPKLARPAPPVSRAREELRSSRATRDPDGLAHAASARQRPAAATQSLAAATFPTSGAAFSTVRGRPEFAAVVTEVPHRCDNWTVPSDRLNVLGSASQFLRA